MQNAGQAGTDGNTQTGDAGTGTSDQGITVWQEDGSAVSGTGQTYDPADVAWTDPNTGLHYDMYGNLLG